MPSHHKTPQLVEQISLTIQPVLKGFSVEIRLGVLADLLSLLLAGHIATTDDATAAYREQLLEQFIAAVRELVPVQEKIILEKIPPEGRA